MTKEEEARHLAFRQGRAQDIASRPQDFKVCGQCNSISFLNAPVCGVCSAYSWLFDAHAVIAIANEIGASAFPATNAVVPRFKKI